MDHELASDQTGHRHRVAVDEVEQLYASFGQRKPMGHSSSDPSTPHFFLLRWFLSELDLLLILNTKRCRFLCQFCNLPAKCSSAFVPNQDVVQQFLFACREVKHSLSVLDRVTLSNEGSVLDFATIPREAIFTIVSAVSTIRSVRTLVLETRVEFVVPAFLRDLRRDVRHVHFDILTGFETRDERIRNELLVKGETIAQFETGLDNVASAGAALTCYVLYKPDPKMSDAEAYEEAESSIAYLVEQTKSRNIPLTIRLNPMYAASGTPWADAARRFGGFLPPRLTDILALAQRVREEGIAIYLGLSSEGLADSEGSYMVREDFSRKLLRKAKEFNRNPSRGDQVP